MTDKIKVKCGKCGEENQVPKDKGGFNCTNCRAWTKVEIEEKIKKKGWI